MGGGPQGVWEALFDKREKRSNTHFLDSLSNSVKWGAWSIQETRPIYDMQLVAGLRLRYD